MKKIWIILLMAGLYQTSALAQDLLVTADGDSLNCIITQINGDYVYFTFRYQNEVRHTLLPRTQVRYYQYDYYHTLDIQPLQIVRYKPEIPRWRLTFNAGWSRRTAPFADVLIPAEKEYLKNLRNGLNINLGISYFFSEMYGVGFKYDLFKTSTSLYGGTESIVINFAGPALAMRFYKKNNCWFMNYSIGYMGFTDKAEITGLSGIMNGRTV